MVGLEEESSVIHLIDFGLMRSIIDPATDEHIPFVAVKQMFGTCRYMSVNAHEMKEQCRRDDLISIGYIVINFIKSGLPWQGI